MGEVTFYRCEKCGNIVTKIIDGGPTPFCCGEKMVTLVPDSSDGAGEKHVPIITVENEIATVKVGEVPHPMEEEHYIQWICLHTEKGLQFVWLKPGEAPEAIFAVAPDDSVIEAYSYCNIHGLWVSAR